MDKEKFGKIILITLAILASVGILFVPPIPQDVTYHNFSDKDTIIGIPNFWNVVSNLPFLLVGICGILRLKSIRLEHPAYSIFFIGVSLTAFGSAYYHWDPNNTTLIWDRLPMTIAFMALFSIIVSEFIDQKIGRKILIPLLLFGFASVSYWMLYDDLRFYALVQFYPIVAILITLLIFKSKYSFISGYWLLLVCYIKAKLLEYFDYETHDMLTFISGHTLKHVIAAVGVGCLLLSYLKRKIVILK